MSVKRCLLGGIVAAVMLLGGGVAGNAVHAEGEEESNTGSANSLLMKPAGMRVQLDEGKTLEGESDGCVTSISDGCYVTVQNNGTKAYDFKVYVSPYAVGNGNEVSFTDEYGTSYTQISRWISIKNKDGEYVDEAVYSIKPGESIKVYYRVKIPDSIPGGSQYAVIWAQIMTDNNPQGGIQTVGQVGSVITGRSTTNSIETAEVSNVSVGRFAFGGDLKAHAKVKNTGNTDFVISHKYVVKTLFGKGVYSKEETTGAFPENEYDIDMTWDELPFLGLFSVEFEIKAADQTVTERHIVVVMPIVVMLLLILLLTVLIVWIIIIIRKRKECKARRLV